MNEKQIRLAMQHLIGYIDRDQLEYWFGEMKEFYGFSEYDIIQLQVRLQLVSEQEALDMLEGLQ